MKKIIVMLALFFFATGITLAYSEQDAQRYSAYYSNGMQYFKNQQYNSAISEFRKVLRFSPYDSTIQNALANAYSARAQYYKNTTKELKKALNDYKSTVFYSKYWSENQSNPTMLQLASSAQREIFALEKRLNIAQNPQSRLQNAKILKAQGELAASGYDFWQIKTGQFEEVAYENLGNIYKNLNNLALAMDYFKTAININPKNPKLHFLYGVMLDEAKNYEASMEQYSLALEYGDKSPELLEILENKWTQNIVNNPNDVQNYINLGAIYQKQGNFENAKNQYLKAIQMGSNDSVVFNNLASLYVQQKNYQGAINVYDKILLNNPNNIEIIEYKAEALKQLMLFEEALKQYENILAINPNHKAAKANIDDIVLNNFSGEKLKNYMMIKASANPKSYEAQFNYALELHKNKDYNNALTYYQKALNLNPTKEETYLNIIQIYLEQKKYKQADEICQKGLFVLPNNPKLTQYLNDIKSYNTNLQFEEANKLFNEKKYIQAIEKYQQIPIKNREINLAIASCYWAMEDFQNANKYYEMILNENPKDIEILSLSAWAYYSMNNFKKTKEIAMQILALDKANVEAQNLISNINQAEYNELLDRISKKYEDEDYNSSLILADELLQKYPNDAYGLYYKALSSDNMEKYKEALNFYEKFLKSKSSAKDDTTEFAKSRITELKNYLSQINGNKK